MVKQQTEPKIVATSAVMPKRSPKSIPGRIPFPRNSLKEAIRIPVAIWKENAGDPFDPILLAKSLGTTHRSSSFMTLVTSSERYGLTEGNVYSKAISLTDIGQEVVAPTDDSLIGATLRKALLAPKLFQEIYTTYDRQNIPREENVKAKLERQFNVPRTDTDACYKIFMQNINDYDMSIKSGESNILYIDNLGKATVLLQKEPQKLPEGEESHDREEQIGEGKIEPPGRLAPEKQVPRQIFVAHGKNKKPLEQTVKILTDYGIPHSVAVEEANRGRPVSVKVAEEMKKCTAGIFIFTADEKTTDADGNEVWRPSDNVVYELGAGSVLYGNKIVIFREEGVDFASDFKEIGYIPFEKNKLDAKGLDLMKELQSLGIIKFQVT